MARPCRASSISPRASATRCWWVCFLSLSFRPFGAFAYGVPFPWDQLPILFVTLLLGAACFCALGLAISGFVPNERAAPAVVNAIILPLLFISDIFIRIPPDNTLAQIGNLFPVRHFALVLQGIWTPALNGPVDYTDLAVGRGLGRPRPRDRATDVQLGVARLGESEGSRSAVSRSARIGSSVVGMLDGESQAGRGEWLVVEARQDVQVGVRHVGRRVPTHDVAVRRESVIPGPLALSSNSRVASHSSSVRSNGDALCALGTTSPHPGRTSAESRGSRVDA